MQPFKKNSQFVRKTEEVQLTVQINESEEQLSIELQTLKSPPKLYALIYSNQNLCQKDKELNINIIQLFQSLQNYHFFDFETDPKNPRVGCKIKIKHCEIQFERLIFLALHQQQYSEEQRLKKHIQKVSQHLNMLKNPGINDLSQDTSSQIKIEQNHQNDCEPLTDAVKIYQNIQAALRKCSEKVDDYLIKSRVYHKQIAEIIKPSQLAVQEIMQHKNEQNKIYLDISDQQQDQKELKQQRKQLQLQKEQQLQNQEQDEQHQKQQQPQQLSQQSIQNQENQNKLSQTQKQMRKIEKKDKRTVKGLRILTKNISPYNISQKKICLIRKSAKTKSHQLVIDYPMKYMYPECQFKIKILTSQSNDIKLGVIDKGNTKTKVTKVAITYHGATGDINDWKVRENQGAGFKELDEIRVRLQNGSITWFVNGQAQATYYSNKLCLHYQIFYPFIEMASEGDVVEWIQI